MGKLVLSLNSSTIPIHSQAAVITALSLLEDLEKTSSHLRATQTLCDLTSVIVCVLFLTQRTVSIINDYGDEVWLAEIMKIWDRIHALFSIQEINWKNTVKKLKEEGHRTQLRGSHDNATLLKQDFDRRISTMDRSLTPIRKSRIW